MEFFFTHVAHSSLRLRITDNSGMSETRLSGMYPHAYTGSEIYATLVHLCHLYQRERERTGVKPLTPLVILFCVVSKKSTFDLRFLAYLAIPLKLLNKI